MFQSSRLDQPIEEYEQNDEVSPGTEDEEEIKRVEVTLIINKHTNRENSSKWRWVMNILPLRLSPPLYF